MTAASLAGNINEASVHLTTDLLVELLVSPSHLVNYS